MKYRFSYQKSGLFCRIAYVEEFYCFLIFILLIKQQFKVVRVIFSEKYLSFLNRYLCKISKILFYNSLCTCIFFYRSSLLNRLILAIDL